MEPATAQPAANLRAALADHIQAAVAAAQAAGALPAFEIPPAVVEKPREAAHGDYATPAAMQLARPARLAPLKIAEAIRAHLRPPAYLAEVSVVAPGFINFRLSPAFLQSQVAEILAQGMRYGGLALGAGRSAQVEFVSANPTGPLTVARGRGGVMGDTLARAMTAAGFEVTREYYSNNAGRQFELLGESLQIRYRQALGRPAELGEEHYQGDYLYWIALTLVGQHGDELLQRPVLDFAKIAELAIFAGIRATLRRLNIRFDVFYNEADLYTTGRVWQALAELEERGYAYRQDGAVWFKSSALGDEKDRVLVRSNGEPTYRLNDIAYHWHKGQRGFDQVVNIFGADHHATAPTVLMGVKALGRDPGFVHLLIHQMVTLIKDGQQVRMSTRRGHFVTLDELMDEVGPDAVRYFMLARSANSTIDFDLTLALERSDKNPVYYIQNAHVRCAGILRKWAEAGLPAGAGREADLSLLSSDYELAFLRRTLELAETLELVVRQYEPHHLAYYAYELAAAFHPAYEHCRVLHSDVPEPLRRARLAFYQAAKQLFGRVLDLMGMSAPETM
ncbi:MAG: arginine--tRNA ligase [Candidatus Promineifilaceae bacterium]